MKQKAFVGIDPRQSGANALFHAEGYEVFDWPGDSCLAADRIRQLCFPYDVKFAALEKGGAWPAQGVVSRFSFGQNLGVSQGIFAALLISYCMPTPQAWRKRLVDSKSGPDTKTQSLVTARRLYFPCRSGPEEGRGLSGSLTVRGLGKE
jgi:hypothetical protein